MTISNELKVGLAVVLAAFIFFAGTRYFQQLPLFGGGADFETQFDNSGGLTEGNPVTISGVQVGRVEDVTLVPASKQVHVRFRVDEDVQLPEGSRAEVSGIGALGGVRLSLQPGPSSNPPLEPGSTVPGHSSRDVVGQLSEQAPAIMSQADSVLMSADRTLSQAGLLLSDPESDLRQTLGALRASASTLNQLLRAEEERLAHVLENMEVITSDVSAFTGTHTDSVGASIEHLNRALTQLNSNLAALETTTDRLNAIALRVEEGEGTLGRLVNDPGLYNKLDSAAARLNTVLLDFQERPGHYLREMSLVDLF